MFVQPALAVVPVDPGDYTRLPGGTNIFATYYWHLTADDFQINGEKVLGNLNLQVDLGIIRYLHYFEVDDWIIVPQFIQTFGHQQVGATDQTVSGVGDSIFGTTFSPLIDPENLQQFGFTLWFTAPTGTEKNRGFILSNNRWTVEGQMAYSWRFHPQWTLDLVADVEGYQDQQNTHLHKAPSFQLNAMMRYHISTATHLGLTYRYSSGGKETLNGRVRTGDIDDHTLIVTWASFIFPQWQLQLQWRQDLDIRQGPTLQGPQARLLYLF